MHELVLAEKGCLLLANPEFFKGTQSYFDKSVIAVLENADEVCMCVCVRVCVRACVRAHVGVCNLARGALYEYACACECVL